ncbi:MAG: HU family DNA-binding protein [Alphaproteobacteria bacterium]|nr:HU family DNA-binding protein [Alphaproteobacteria bacterium]
MNKSELVAAIAEKSGLTQVEASKALGAFCDSVSEALANGSDVQITGFGGFTISERAARTGRNPQTGAKIKIAASKAPKFKAGKGLKDAVNG